ncbi:hypothetical protein [Prochlorococcus sp. MIT 0701]
MFLVAAISPHQLQHSISPGQQRLPWDWDVRLIKFQKIGTTLL